MQKFTPPTKKKIKVLKEIECSDLECHNKKQRN